MRFDGGSVGLQPDEIRARNLEARALALFLLSAVRVESRCGAVV
jgi:hypothetical protein